jgi:lipopolysaccharide export LptBFGC system permease protein LptF
MQAVLIVLPILIFGLLTAILLAWVLFVTLPRMRRAEAKRSTQATRHA